MVFKIAYCAGHGFNTAGKRTPNGEREWTFNDKNAVAFAKEMSKYENIQLKRMDDPTGRTDVPLKTRTNNANSWDADIYISFHHNALASRWGTHTGVEVFYSKGSINGLKLAKLVLPEIVKAYGLRDRGIKTNILHITRATRMPSILVEGGFMDSTIDIVKLRSNTVLANAGIGTAKAVVKYAGLKLKATPKPTVPKAPIPAKPTGQMYRVRKSWSDDKSQIGAYSILQSAKDLANKNKDFKVFDSNGKIVYDPKPTVPVKKDIMYRVRKTWANTSSQIGAYKSIESAKELADSKAKEGYKVFDDKGNVVYASKVVVKDVIHTVVKGDTLWGIAKKYSVKIDDIKSKNGLKSNTLDIGQKLIIKGEGLKKK